MGLDQTGKRAPLGRDLGIILMGVWGLVLQLWRSVGRRPRGDV